MKEVRGRETHSTCWPRSSQAGIIEKELDCYSNLIFEKRDKTPSPGILSLKSIQSTQPSQCRTSHEPCYIQQKSRVPCLRIHPCNSMFLYETLRIRPVIPESIPPLAPLPSFQMPIPSNLLAYSASLPRYWLFLSLACSSSSRGGLALISKA